VPTTVVNPSPDISLRHKLDMKIGVISDTQGLPRPQAVYALAGSDLILHAGDIGKPEVLEALRAIAPVIAVRGNNDHGSWAEAILEHQTVAIGTVSLYLLHILKDLPVDP
jgi:putative phosphoesterase